MEINDLGCLAVVADPGGARVGIWQPEALLGADVTGQPGSMYWNELQTHDADRARGFYGRVFGWTAPEAPASDRYVDWRAQGLPCGGMTLVDSRTPARWLTHIGVMDCDAAAEKCEELGGTVRTSPADTPRGRSAVLSDPQGAVFAVTAPWHGEATHTS
ncbi:VOC family protein [Streptomyces sp. NPDC002537]